MWQVFVEESGTHDVQLSMTIDIITDSYEDVFLFAKPGEMNFIQPQFNLEFEVFLELYKSSYDNPLINFEKKQRSTSCIENINDSINPFYDKPLREQSNQTFLEVGSFSCLKSSSTIHLFDLTDYIT